MTKINAFHKTTTSSSRVKPGERLHVVDRVVPRSNVVSISSSAPLRGPELVRRTSPRRLIGRKGREALERRRALEAAFLTAAMGTVALIWWSAF